MNFDINNYTSYLVDVSKKIEGSSVSFVEKDKIYKEALTVFEKWDSELSAVTQQMLVEIDSIDIDSLKENCQFNQKRVFLEKLSKRIHQFFLSGTSIKFPDNFKKIAVNIESFHEAVSNKLSVRKLINECLNKSSFKEKWDEITPEHRQLFLNALQHLQKSIPLKEKEKKTALLGMLTILTSSQLGNNLARLSELMLLGQKDHSYAGLADKILVLWMKDPDRAYRIQDVAIAGYPHVSDSLLKMHAQHPPSEFAMQCLRLTSSHHAALVYQMILLQGSQQPIDLRICDFFAKSPIAEDATSYSILEVLIMLRQQSQLTIATKFLDAYESKPEEESGKIVKELVINYLTQKKMRMAFEALENSDSVFLENSELVFKPKLAEKIVQMKDDMLSQAGQTSFKTFSEILKPLCFMHVDEDKLCELLSGVQFLAAHTAPSELDFYLLMVGSMVGDDDQSEAIDTTLHLINSKIEEIISVKVKQLALSAQKDKVNYQNVALELSQMMFSLSGNLNREIVVKISEHVHKNPLKTLLDPTFLGRLNLMLKIVAKDSYFADRIAIVSPAQNPRVHALLKQMLSLGDREITNRDARVAVMSALLWPLSQVGATSCFATHAVMYLATFAEGVKQLMEDYMSIIGSGRLTRAEVQYPLHLNPDTFFKMLQGDNFLARAHEYTLASMGAGLISTHIRKNCSKELVKLLRQYWEKQGKMKLETAEQLSIAVEEYLEKEFSRELDIVYCGDIENSETKELGVWTLLDKQLGEIITLPEQLKDVYNAVLQSFNNIVAKEFSSHSEIIEQSINHIMGNYPADIYAPPTSISRGQWEWIFETYYEQRIPSGPIASGKNSLESIGLTFNTISDRQMQIYHDNPAMLKSIFYEGHICNMKMAQLTFLQDRSQRDKLYQQMVSGSKLWGSTKIEISQMVDVVNTCLDSLDLGEKEYGLAKLTLLHDLVIEKPGDVKHLCQTLLKSEIFSGARGPNPKIKMVLATKITEIYKAKYGKMPTIIPIADMNWTSIQMALICCPPDDQLIEIFINDRFEPQYIEPHGFKGCSSLGTYHLRPPHELLLKYYVPS